MHRARSISGHRRGRVAVQSSPGNFCDRSNLLRCPLFPSHRALRDGVHIPQFYGLLSDACPMLIGSISHLCGLWKLLKEASWNAYIKTLKRYTDCDSFYPQIMEYGVFSLIFLFFNLVMTTESITWGVYVMVGP